MRELITRREAFDQPVAAVQAERLRQHRVRGFMDQHRRCLRLASF